MPITRYGALAVVEEAHPKDSIQQLLRQLDERLFLEKQITLTNEQVWCVVCDVGLDQPPMTILEWRDAEGRPLPYLTASIVDRVARMDRGGSGLYAKVVRANAAMIERRRREALAEWEEISADMIPRMAETRSAVLPRGQWLRRSRDRLRRQGRKL